MRKVNMTANTVLNNLEVFSPLNTEDEKVRTNRTSLPIKRKIKAQRSVQVDKLLDKQNELTLIHNGENYLLRITSKNKLILTK